MSHPGPAWATASHAISKKTCGPTPLFSNMECRNIRTSVPDMCYLKGEFTFFFIRELDVLPLGESNLMDPKKSVEVKFFTVAFFLGAPNVINNAGFTVLP